MLSEGPHLPLRRAQRDRVAQWLCPALLGLCFLNIFLWLRLWVWAHGGKWGLGSGPTSVTHGFSFPLSEPTSSISEKVCGRHPCKVAGKHTVCATPLPCHTSWVPIAVLVHFNSDRMQAQQGAEDTFLTTLVLKPTDHQLLPASPGCLFLRDGVWSEGAAQVPEPLISASCVHAVGSPRSSCHAGNSYTSSWSFPQIPSKSSKSLFAPLLPIIFFPVHLASLGQAASRGKQCCSHGNHRAWRERIPLTKATAISGLLLSPGCFPGPEFDESKWKSEGDGELFFF